MKRTKTRRSKPNDPFDTLCRLGDKLKETYGQVRYSECVYHDGRQWTKKADWERFEDGQWVVIELPVENY